MCVQGLTALWHSDSCPSIFTVINPTEFAPETPWNTAMLS